MKRYIIKIMLVVLIISSFINICKSNKHEKVIIAKNVVINNLVYQSESYNVYKEPVVYNGKTLSELGEKIDKLFNSSLDGYGKIVASKALDKGVDPLVAASIILIETGCKWECSNLVKYNNNVGGMRYAGKYITYLSLEEGIDAFVSNLANNYYAKGLNTPELINTKYAMNPNWYQKVYYYINLIEAS